MFEDILKQFSKELREYIRNVGSLINAPKERDRVVHKKYKHYGTGVIIEIARSGVRALCVFPDANPPVIAYYKIDNLVVALKKNN
ncbi:MULTISPECIES: hypothetical protein [Paenibacillus]|uniref:hypothetical protein n=1 Tax=Paenibacillus TaxID=44249 RepID=UPI0011D26930|nr:hypothetical protein [Paenibacillus lautus]